jgi:flagellar hook assembly protein FlgD
MQLEVFDANGRVHFSTNQIIQPTGNKIILDWNGKTTGGGLLAPGKYYYKVVIQQKGLVEQMLNGLLKL